MNRHANGSRIEVATKRKREAIGEIGYDILSLDRPEGFKKGGKSWL
jgi:hypothetical protein